MRVLRLLGRLVVGVACAGTIAWGAAALWIDGPASRPLARILVGGFVGASLALLRVIRPRRRALAAFLALFVLVLAWWLGIPPRSDRDWLPEVARTASAEIRGQQLTIHNLRNFDYRSETDFTERWEDRTYDLSRLRGLDLFLSFWGPTAIAHTIMSWEFDDGPPLAISIETRKEKGESYSALLGFFRQYELYYVVADERDVIRLRTGYRGERVYLYRLRTPVDRARALLLNYLDEVNRLATRPKWYNALTHNCTTTIQLHVRDVTPREVSRGLLDWRLLANGYAGEMLYERGVVNTTLPFPQLKAASDVTERARAAEHDPEFSRRIREGLPERPAFVSGR